MPLVATNTTPVPFHISMCWYLTVFTGENLQVFQSDPSCLQPPLDEILSRIDFRKILFCEALVAEQCGMWFLEIDLKTKILHIIECRGPLLFLQNNCKIIAIC